MRRNELQATLDRHSQVSPSAVSGPADTPVSPSSDTASPGVALVDIDRLRDITDDEPDRIRRLIDLYMTQTAPMLDGLNEAILTNSGAEVASIAHKLVGASVSCGVEAFTVSLHELEQLGQAGDLSGARILLDDVQAKFPQVQSLFAQFIQTLKPPSPMQ